MMAAEPNLAFGTFNGYAPKDGPRILRAAFDFSAVTSIPLDLYIEEANKQLGFVQSIFIDNSLVNAVFTLTCLVTNLKLSVPPNSQAILPLYSIDQSQFVVTSPGGASVPVHFCNFPQPYLVWAALASTSFTAAITAASGSFASGSQPIGITPTDRTITSMSGISQQLMAANATRKHLTVSNTGNANIGINPTGGVAVIGGAGTLTLVPGGSYGPAIPTLSAVSVIGTAGQPVYADES